MSINKTDQYNWQKSTKLDRVRFGGKASPNIVAICDYLKTRWAGTKLGIVNKRNVRGGDVLSTHYFGAALDWRYPTRSAGMSAMKWLVSNSKELGVQMVVDYVGSSIWTAKGGWRHQEPNKHGMGQSWAKFIHIETTKSMWGVKSAVTERLK